MDHLIDWSEVEPGDLIGLDEYRAEAGSRRIYGEVKAVSTSGIITFMDGHVVDARDRPGNRVEIWRIALKAAKNHIVMPAPPRRMPTRPIEEVRKRSGST